MRKMLSGAERMIRIDPWLEQYREDLNLREERFSDIQNRLGCGQDLSAFANGSMYFGLHRTEDGWVFREWLPGADEVHLIGDMNGWDKQRTPLTRKDHGEWEGFIPGKDAIKHRMHYKLWVRRGEESFERIPAYVRFTSHDPTTGALCGMVWEPEEPYKWSDAGYRERKKEPPLIYEAHIGMAQEKEGIGSYREFADRNLLRIRELGYNAVQLMAIAEHPYYASFGYQVTNFFAPSGWYGEPDDLKYLIDRAHTLGLRVLLDVVHSHACPNEGEGLNRQDGTEGQYFLCGDRGWHPAWKTRLFDYARPEVLHFLLSNLKYWMEEFHFDGFRFDGVTSMIYQNHGLGCAFTDYSQYFSMNTDLDALSYLRLANMLIHQVDPGAITVAEEMSGMPGMCIPVEKGGYGFDYRLSMGLPDLWIRLLKEYRDEDWDMFRLWYELTTRRPQEKCIAYAESHDQALVGDKTLIFRMADAEMYTGMDKAYHSPVIDRAVDLHKLIRFVTLSLAGDGYLNFMGNEFGHPEWIDFPREGNGWSYKYARRQWSLVENGYLKYSWLENFDRAMLKFASAHKVLRQKEAVNLWTDPEKKIFSFCKGKLIYVFNFNTVRSETDFFVHTHLLGAGDFRVIFSTDDPEFGGQERIDRKNVYHSAEVTGKGNGFTIYVPCRCALVIGKMPEKKTKRQHL